jgi:hypothetical protein
LRILLDQLMGSLKGLADLVNLEGGA